MPKNEPFYKRTGPTSQINLLCGSTAEFDEESGICYRCTSCFAVVGSIGMPTHCKMLYEAEHIVDKLKGKS
jgi:hypothetical protein